MTRPRNPVVVARWSELADRRPAHARVAETDLVVIRDGEVAHVLHGQCTHRGALLSDGQIEGNDLVCAAHGWDYELSTGVSRTDPCERIGRFEARVDAGANTVTVDENAVRAWLAANPSVFDDGELSV